MQARRLSKTLLMMATPSSTFNVASSAGVVSQFVVSVVVVVVPVVVVPVVVAVLVLSVVAVVPLAVAFRRKLSSSLSHNALHAKPEREGEGVQAEGVALLQLDT